MSCTPENLGCKPPEPGSVTPHAAHLLLKLPLPAGADRSKTDEAWWVTGYYWPGGWQVGGRWQVNWLLRQAA